MQLQEHTPENHFYVHSLGPEAIQIAETRYSHSLILSPDQGVASWPVNSIGELETHHLQPILDWRPDVVLLATGRRQRFPERSIQIEMLRNNVGLEVMTLESAARTFNILASEDRRVVAALIWEPGACDY